jgi:hypothetical protein
MIYFSRFDLLLFTINYMRLRRFVERMNITGLTGPAWAIFSLSSSRPRDCAEALWTQNSRCRHKGHPLFIAAAIG